MATDTSTISSYDAILLLLDDGYGQPEIITAIDLAYEQGLDADQGDRTEIRLNGIDMQVVRDTLDGWARQGLTGVALHRHLLALAERRR